MGFFIEVFQETHLKYPALSSQTHGSLLAIILIIYIALNYSDRFKLFRTLLALVTIGKLTKHGHLVHCTMHFTSGTFYMENLKEY